MTEVKKEGKETDATKGTRKSACNIEAVQQNDADDNVCCDPAQRGRCYISAF